MRNSVPTALDAQRVAIAKECSRASARVALTLRVLVDAGRREMQRSVRQDDGVADPALLACVVGDPHKLEVGPLGEPTAALELWFP